VRGSAILRELRQLTTLPLRRETIYHLVFNPHGTEPPSVNRLIAIDPALALAILRLVPRHFREGKLGIAQIARFATPKVLLELVQQSTALTGVDAKELSTAFDQLWTHSIATAHAARYLSRSRHYDHPQTAYLAGLLHNTGLLAVAHVAPELVSDLLSQPEPPHGWLAAEHERFGTNHTNLANQLAKRWSLPQWLHEVVWWHHQPEESLPPNLSDRALVELVREADSLVAQGDFALGRPTDSKSWRLPWKSDDALVAAVTRGVRQAARLVHDHPLRASGADSNQSVARAVELAIQNTALHRELDWRKAAWEEFATMPPDVTPAELTGLVAETFANALGSLGVACYVRSDDGASAEGSFWCDGSRPVTCSLDRGKDAKPHAIQIVAKLRPTWQQRAYREIELAADEESIAHVLIWQDEFGPAPSEDLLDQAGTLCTSWLAHACHIACLETQLESLTAALRNQASEAEARLENAKLGALAELAAGAGHEINNPLAVISGRAQLLIAEETDPRRRKSLETIVGQAQRIHRMIVDLMTFARPAAPDCKPLDILEAIDRAAAAVKAEADANRISVTVTADVNLPQVSGDIAQLAAAIECILRNSLEATSEGGSVQVVAKVAIPSGLQVRITDTGHGITDDQRRHIFEPFYSGREAGRGLGMGLPKAWRTVQNHGGEILVESGPQGTSITVRLPAVAAVPAAGQDRVCA
jgi:signal transduction histidine kinase/HD-like signal output (HDOD) protein